MTTSPRWIRALALLPALAGATTLRPHSLAERAQDSTRVSLVRVLSRESVADAADPRRIKTFTELLVAEDLKGEGPQRVTLVQVGGTVGLWSMQVPGDAEFAVGETALVFLKCPQASRCYLVALGEGKVPVVGAEAMVHDMFSGQITRRKLVELVAELRRATPESAPAPSRVRSGATR